MALVNCPRCGRLVTDRAVTCPTCAYAFKVVKPVEKPVSPSSSVLEPLPASKPDPHTPKISRTRYTIGIVLNVLVGGSGWLLAPIGQKLLGWFFLILWVLTGFIADDNISRLALGAVNIISAVIFGINFSRYVVRV